MKSINLLSSMVLFLICGVSVADENVASELHIDPFINPLETMQIEAVEANENTSTESATTVGETPRTSFLFQPELRGVILSDDIAIANIGGEMIGLGEKYEGYRLIKVKGQSVVFEKNGKQYPVSLDGTDEDEDTL